MSNAVVDPRVLVMAAVRGPQSPGAPWSMGEVGEIATKIKVALDADVGIDTVATVGRSAVAEARAALAGRKDVRVLELDREMALPVERREAELSL